jgi:hypothetical protein
LKVIIQTKIKSHVDEGSGGKGVIVYLITALFLIILENE